MIWLSLFLYLEGLFLWLTLEKTDEEELDIISYFLAFLWPLVTLIGAGMVLCDQIKKKN